MAFKIAQKPSYKSPVKVDTPNDKGGFDTSTFTAEFKRVSFEELEVLRNKPQKDVIKDVLLGYSDLLDGDENPLDFNEGNVDILLEIPQALAALSNTFWSSIIKSKEKN